MEQYIVWILLAGCVGLHLWMMRKGHHGSHKSHDCHDHGEHGKSDTMNAKTKDPVCGMEIDAANAKHSSERQGVVHYFCSASCRDQFVADPEKFIN